MNLIAVTHIEQTFQELYQSGSFSGGQLVVHHNGSQKVNQAVGWLDGKKRHPVSPDTPFITFSISKIFTYFCIYKLLEERKIEWDMPVAHYWPEYGKHGKETTTIRQVLLHQAGLPGEKRFIQIPLSASWQLITNYVARQKPEHPPGSQVAYHLVNSGFILGEVVRRATGLSIRDYLQQAFLVPMQLQNTHLGIPSHILAESAQLNTQRGGYRGAQIVFNLPFVRKAIIPAASLHSSASDIARFLQMILNGGEIHHTQYISPEMITEVTALQYDGYDATLKRPTRWSYGLQIGGAYKEGERMGSGSTVSTFGHFGLDTCMVWADSRAQLIVVFFCNTLVSNEESLWRLKTISDSVWQAL